MSQATQTLACHQCGWRRWLEVFIHDSTDVHPERVRHKILLGAFECGWQVRGNAQSIKEWSALVTLLRLGWGQNNPAFRQIFTTRFIPDAGSEQREWVDRLQQVSSSPARGRDPAREVRPAAQPQPSGARARARMGHPGSGAE